MCTQRVKHRQLEVTIKTDCRNLGFSWISSGKRSGTVVKEDSSFSSIIQGNTETVTSFPSNRGSRVFPTLGLFIKTLRHRPKNNVISVEYSSRAGVEEEEEKKKELSFRCPSTRTVCLIKVSTFPPSTKVTVFPRKKTFPRCYNKNEKAVGRSGVE